MFLKADRYPKYYYGLQLSLYKKQTMEKHNLHHEFPEFDQKITEYKVNNEHFRKLFDEYQQVTDEVYKIETGTEVASDDVLHKLKTHRLYLKDQLYSLLQN
jgi:uncharacterized protein YdcH (DUF465 family)